MFHWFKELKGRNKITLCSSFLCVSMLFFESCWFLLLIRLHGQVISCPIRLNFCFSLQLEHHLRLVRGRLEVVTLLIINGPRPIFIILDWWLLSHLPYHQTRIKADGKGRQKVRRRPWRKTSWNQLTLWSPIRRLENVLGYQLHWKLKPDRDADTFY